ncbi:MAG: toxic anion resistance protein [Faecalibacterium sp.]|jgi:uncharacterized protein YaaN involved in tellurite resistance|nr:toxic anion resistance protein [Faecalibacterium sp.]
MAENENNAIELSLDEPTSPSLTLDPTGDIAAAAEQEKKEEQAKAAKPVEAQIELSPEEQKAVDDFAEKIDITNSQQVLQYGASSQKKIGDFSEAALSKVRTKDLGEVGGMITNLVTELKNFNLNEEDQKGFMGFFKKKALQIEQLKTRYNKVETNVENIQGMLEQHQVTLLKDIAMLDKMYALNMTHYKELSMYILAGKKKLAEVRANELQAAVDKAHKTGLPEDAQAARDLSDMCERFEKKLYDLELTRNISIQMGPQIRLIQNNDTMMAEKIQSTILNTIPLWKNQMVLALGMAHSQQAMEAERAVTDMTNDLLKKNAEALKMGTIETAKESQRGIVDIETLQTTNRSLIETLDELNKIQTEGREKRAAAEVELGRIEGELKQKMMEINR